MGMDSGFSSGYYSIAVAAVPLTQDLDGSYVRAMWYAQWETGPDVDTYIHRILDQHQVVYGHNLCSGETPDPFAALELALTNVRPAPRTDPVIRAFIKEDIPSPVTARSKMKQEPERTRRGNIRTGKNPDGRDLYEYETSSFTLPRNSYADLKKLAEEREVTMGHIVREALEQYLGKPINKPKKKTGKGWRKRDRSAASANSAWDAPDHPDDGTA